MEKSLYEPVKKALEENFKKLGNCYFEITAKGKISDKLKRYFDDIDLHIINVEKFSPDLIGYVIKGFFSRDNLGLGKAEEIIVVEVKNNLKLKDIYQAKQYGEIFNAKYTLLIYSEPLAEEIRRFLKQRPDILSHSAGYQQVRMAQFDEAEGKIKEDTWSSSPFEEDSVW